MELVSFCSTSRVVIVAGKGGRPDLGFQPVAAAQAQRIQQDRQSYDRSEAQAVAAQRTGREQVQAPARRRIDRHHRLAAEPEDGADDGRHVPGLVEGRDQLGAAVARSAIRFAGEAILVNYRPLTRPYVLTAIGSTAIHGTNDLVAAIATHHPGDHVQLTVERGSQTIKLTATLGTQPTKAASTG